MKGTVMANNQTNGPMATIKFVAGTIGVFSLFFTVAMWTGKQGQQLSINTKRIEQNSVEIQIIKERIPSDLDERIRRIEEATVRIETKVEAHIRTHKAIADNDLTK
jgi:hypothetical protein